MDGVLGTELDAGIAFGAHLGLLIEAFIEVGEQHHEVVGTDIDA